MRLRHRGFSGEDSLLVAKVKHALASGVKLSSVSLDVGEDVPESIVKDFYEHLASSGTGGLTVGLFGGRVQRLLLGLPEETHADLDMAYGLCDIEGNPIRPFSALKPKIAGLRDRIAGFATPRFQGEELLHPWVMYFNFSGSFFKPGVKSKVEFKTFSPEYTIGNIILMTDGIAGRFIDPFGGVPDLLEGRLHLSGKPGADIPAGRLPHIAALGIRYKNAYGMEFEDETRRRLTGAVRQTYTREELTDPLNLRSLAKLSDPEFPQELVAGDLKAFGLLPYITQALRYDDNTPTYRKIRALAGGPLK